MLFVASFLHDLGGLAGFEKEGVDHGVRSVELIEPLLQQWGFPMSKFAQVKEMIIGHVYTSPAPASPQAQAFRDADIVDFLGSIGVARILAVTQEAGRASPTLKPLVDLLKNFASTLPPKCSLRSCKDLAVTRKAEMDKFFGELDLQSLRGSAL